MVGSVNNSVSNANMNAIHPDFKPNPKHGKKIPVKIQGGGQLIITQSGKMIQIKPMMGSSTHVEPLKNGTYKVTYKPTLPNAKEKVTIMSEEEFVAKYGNKAPTASKLDTVA